MKFRKHGRGGKHYRHRASPDCNTVASFESGSSGSRGGLNRYYRQAWENLHETAGHKTNGNIRRKETLDEPGYRDNYRSHSNNNNNNSTNNNNNNNNTERDGSELVVNDVAAYLSGKPNSANDKKRHHHHHHHHHPSSERRQSHHRY